MTMLMPCENESVNNWGHRRAPDTPNAARVNWPRQAPTRDAPAVAQSVRAGIAKESDNILVKRRDQQAEARDSLSTSYARRNDGVPWDFKNRRRLKLINRKFQTGLSQREEAELDALQIEYGDYLDAMQPPPIRMLEHLESLAKQLESKLTTSSE